MQVTVLGATKFVNQNALIVSSGAAGTIWTPATGKKVRLMGMIISSTSAGNMLLKIGANLIIPFYFASAGQTINVDLGPGVLAANINDSLVISNNTGGSSTFYVAAWGTEE